jgi:hypothetical protein
MEDRATMMVQFRHEKTYFDCPNGRAQILTAMRWAEQEFGMRRELLRADVRYRERKRIEVTLNERLLATEGLEFPDECLVWVGLDRRRFKQFRGQRVIDLTYEMGLHEGKRPCHAGSRSMMRRIVGVPKEMHRRSAVQKGQVRRPSILSVRTWLPG